ncbi:ABC transporter substrate-binding protein [Pendulispora rubella]|uniref:ABC transporter substrate-binding protein n=1 Tax=Pendulispora rubella TaxID=2741070 RepID=A0ABZ2L237_9BACT
MRPHHTVLVFSMAAMLAANGCTGILGIDSDPQVTTQSVSTCQGTVYVRIASDFSGTATDIAIPYFFGIYDYLRTLNDNGGIRGCQIDIQTGDNKYTPGETEKVVQGWRSSDAHWKEVNTVFLFGTGPTTAVGPELAREKKLIIPGSYAGSLASPDPINKTVSYTRVNDGFQEAQFNDSKTSTGWPYVFFPATDYATAIRVAIKAAFAIQPGRMAFAHEVSNICAYCTDPLAAGASFIPSITGMSLGRDLIIPQTSSEADTNTILRNTATYFDQEIARFISTNGAYEPVSWVWSGNSVFATAVLARGVALAQTTIDNNPEVRKILDANPTKKWKLRVMANNWGIGETASATCGAGCNGDLFYGLFPVPRYGDIQNATEMVQLIAVHDNYANKDSASPPSAPITMVPNSNERRKPESFRDVRYVQGFAAAILWEKAMGIALDAGHRNPTGEDLKNALETFRLVDMGGLTAGPISFSAKDHRPQSNASIYKLDSKGELAFVDKLSISLVNEWLGY